MNFRRCISSLNLKTERFHASALVLFQTMSVRLCLLLVISFFSSAKCQVRYCEKICSNNEVFSYNVSQCQNTCFESNYSQSKKCPVGPGCTCKNGYIRHQDTYQCIPTTSCYDKRTSKSCPMNEFYSDCDASCQKSCSSIYSTAQCQCSNGCVCRTGYFRSDINYQCQTARDCQSKSQTMVSKQFSNYLTLERLSYGLFLRYCCQNMRS